MSSNLIQVTVTITQVTPVATSTGAAYAGTSVVVTDSTGVAQPAVVLQAPTLSFIASVALGAGTVVATAMNVNGVALEAPVSQTFTEAGSPQTFPPTGTITVTPVVAGAAAAARKA